MRSGERWQTSIILKTWLLLHEIRPNSRNKSRLSRRLLGVGIEMVCLAKIKSQKPTN